MKWGLHLRNRNDILIGGFVGLSFTELTQRMHSNSVWIFWCTKFFLPVNGSVFAQTLTQLILVLPLRLMICSQMSSVKVLLKQFWGKWPNSSCLGLSYQFLVFEYFYIENEYVLFSISANQILPLFWIWYLMFS